MGEVARLGSYIEDGTGMGTLMGIIWRNGTWYGDGKSCLRRGAYINLTGFDEHIFSQSSQVKKTII